MRSSDPIGPLNTRSNIAHPAFCKMSLQKMAEQCSAISKEEAFNPAQIKMFRGIAL